ncbi:MAG: hypothetical protein KJ718_00600 [Nanoarchaeota archaeon]|nr:hypothetical protein [Nanoarchaeota archaeon]MBU1051040.1 hypothetical protein [Nanoarchaeota archaeon]MBU1989038.1 hypothetical protein [Nanoarchaeota archaeon]
MKIKPYFEKLEQAEIYKNFKIKYPDSFLIAGFFVLDIEGGNNVHQIDFYVPEEKKIAAFTLDGEITLKLLETMNDSVPEKLDINTTIDLDALQGVLTDEMRNRGMSEDVRKIIAVIQNIKGKRIWNLNCVLTGMEILKSHVEDESKTVLKIEKSSIIDIMKKMPSQKLMKAPETKDEVKDELQKLDKIEEEIEKARANLKEELKEKKKN